jgi:hypothetical protein
MLFFVSVQLQAQNPQTGNVATDLDNPNFITAYPIDAIGGTYVDVYKNAANQYFYSPPLLVDWNNFNTQLENYKNQPDKNIVRLKLRINYYKKEVFDELKMRIERGQGKDNIILNILPYTYFVLKAKIGDDYFIMNPSDLPTFSNIGQLKTKYTITSPTDYIISGSLKDMRDFYAFKSVASNLKGSLFSGGNEYSSDYVKGTADFANSTSIKKQLFGDETLKNDVKVSSESDGGGLSLSLGPLKFGGGTVNSTVWTQNEKKRIVNRNYTSKLVTDNQTQIHILSDGTADRIRETKSRILDYLLKTVSTQVSLDFKQVGENEYNLVQGTLVYANIQGGELETLLKSKPQYEITAGSKQSGSYAGASGSNEDNITQKTNDDITWQNKGDGKGWIPSKVDMYILSEYQLKNSVLIVDVSYIKEGKKTINADFIYPAVWLSEHPEVVTQYGVDRDNPIGSILPFAGKIDKIPAGWRLCNGDSLPLHGNEEVFNIIGYNWGKGNNDDFKLPDLRGVFLRGVSYDSGKDPDVDERTVNGEGEKNNVGSFQKDVFTEHYHLIGRSSVGDGGGLLGGDLNYMLGGKHKTEGAKYGNDESGGKETRPKNVYVNYIIRCK